MKRSIIFLISLLSILILSACNSDERPRREPKPRRDSTSGTLPWARPADWEGGLPGMSGGIGSQNNNY